MVKKTSKPKTKIASKPKARKSATDAHSTAKKDVGIYVRVSVEEAERIKYAAKQHNQSKSDFIREAVINRASQLENGINLSYLEQIDGEWRFKGRKLKAFQNYYLMTHSAYSDKEWADLYCLPIAAISQLRDLCEIYAPNSYTDWVENYEKEASEEEDGIQFL